MGSLNPIKQVYFVYRCIAYTSSVAEVSSSTSQADIARYTLHS